MRFSYQSNPARMVFGRGTARSTLPIEVHRLGAQRLLVVTPRSHEGLARALTEPFAGVVVAWFTDIAPTVPVQVVQSAAHTARMERADAVLSLGGRPTTMTAKAVARELRLTLVAIPTTYSGSEATPLWGVTRDGREEGGASPAAQPHLVVLDPDLTDRQSRSTALASGLSAVAQAVEAQWAPGANPISTAIAQEALGSLVAGLRGLGPQGLAGAHNPEQALADPVGTWAGSPATTGEQLLYGAYLAGAAFGVTGGGLHQRICQVLSAAFGLPQAETAAVLLPHVLALNAPAVPEATERIARALGTPDPVRGLRRLSDEAGAPRYLTQLGLGPRQLDEAVERVSAALPVANPRPVGRAEIRAILTETMGGSSAA